MSQIRMSIDGLEFMETQDRVRNQLEGAIGIMRVEMHEGQDYVDVSFNDETTSDEISSHLQNNGYKITEIM